MKVTVNNKENDSEKPFPKLMISEMGRIVLFIKDPCGFDLTEGAAGFGVVSDSWDISNFKDFTGTVTLENDND